ncbi:MAG: hypothetical protein NC041_09920 [Bacteroides sp.]|nr:hypothetical protein [Prevotella sp.]MCM1408872.1 hypothetical protein [Treponema brennaborense]MCM1470768.1 hypothetical protein [Bacteroides sp.]
MNNSNRKHAVFFCLCLLLCMLHVSCNKKTDADEIPPQLPAEKPAVQWFCFHNGAVKKIQSPSDSPETRILPWTEAVRISSAVQTSGGAYFIVNRLGLMLCGGGTDIELKPDPLLFGGKTADTLMLIGNIPVFHLYSNAFFSENSALFSESEQIDGAFGAEESFYDAASNAASQIILASYRIDSGLYFPVLTKSDLGILPNAEAISLVYANRDWLFSVKTAYKQKTDFSYIKLHTYQPLTDIPPANAQPPFSVMTISQKEYREQKEPTSFENAPPRLHALLSRLPQDFPFTAECRYADPAFIRYGTTKVFTRGGNPADENSEDEAAIQTCSAVLAETYSVAVFPDGTLFFSGALPNKYSGTSSTVPAAFRLPKLPPSFSYGVIGAAGNTLYAAWEESSFYKTGRAGFIAVDLEKILY